MRRRAFGLVLLVAVVSLAERAVAAPPHPFEVFGLVRFDSGIKAPAFTLADLHGHPVSVSAPAGSAVLVVFWATW